VYDAGKVGETQMHKSFQFRIYPTKEQATLIHKSMGCSRFVFNHFFKSERKLTNKPERSLPILPVQSYTDRTQERMDVVERSGFHPLAKYIEAFGRCIQMFLQKTE
jgi:putative transposase